MSIHTRVKNLVLLGNRHQKVAILCSFCIAGIIILSTNHVQQMRYLQNSHIESYIKYDVKDLESRRLHSAVDVKIYNGNNLQKLSESTNPGPTIEKSTTSFISKRSKLLNFSPENRNSNGHFINFQDIVNSNIDIMLNKKERIPSLDNTSNYRPGQRLTNNRPEKERTLKETNEFQKHSSNISSILKKSNNSNQTLVLLVTYLRSGSTFTADLIQQASDMFYIYEPLKPYVKGQHYFTMDSVCHTINGTCRKQKGRRENIDNILDDLAKFYKCDLLHVPISYFRYSNKSTTMHQFDHCRHYNTEYNCLLKFQDKCRKSVRMIKTIRMNMKVAEKLIEEFPQLKIIHLIRDPRGSYQSRKNGYFLKNQNDLDAITRSNCDHLKSDLKIGSRLKAIYPDRIKTILYETVAEQPLKAARSLFRFLGLTEPANFESWLGSHTKAGYSNGYYDTVRRNSTTTANLWRKYINLKVVKSFDQNCKKVYKILGLKELPNYPTLHNTFISSRYKSPVFGEYFE
ncbi:CHST1 [Mytilus coruscus]|uniref:CHST1 n=1 Tax=Mytilus coruscus TaxID=42192 RepID=A0A6J8A977_MYTCO|nr:CHST1 [Mytilus coruscus]